MLSLAKADGRYLKILTMLSNVEVLALDDRGVVPLPPSTAAIPP